MREAADLRLLKLDASPFNGVLLAERLDDLDHAGPAGEAFLLELLEGLVRRGAGGADIGEDAVARIAAGGGHDRGRRDRGRGGGGGGRASEAAHHFIHDGAQEFFVNLQRVAHGNQREAGG